ncbi:MAG: hypothetical protein NVS2B8_19390 [Vulcanimicrobiaceae bacterium]
MSTYVLLGFAGVGLTVFVVAWVTLGVLVLALLAAATNHFFRSVPSFDEDLREVTMEMEPADRRRFFELYASLRPKSPAVAWFLAVVLGPMGANLYRQKWGAFLAALVSLNGLGAWWLESWYTTPHLVQIDNRAAIAYALQLLAAERSREASSPDVLIETRSSEAGLVLVR